MTPGGRSDASWRAVQGAVIVLVAGFFLFSLRDILGPFLLYGVLVSLLVPFRGVRGRAILVTTATVLVLMWLLHVAGSLLAPFILAFVLAYVFDPLVDRLSARPRVGRSSAIFLILVPFLAGTAAVAIVGIPALTRQAGALIGEVSRIVEEIGAWVRTLDPASPGFDIPLVDEAALLTRIQDLDAQTAVEFLETRLAEVAAEVWTAVLGLGRGIGTLLTVLSYLVLTPVLAFYLLRDYDLIVQRTRDLMPEWLRPGADSFLGEYDTLLSRYLRGQVSVAVILGCITWLGLLVVGFPYSFLLGATAGVLSVVPYVGLMLSLIPAVLIALTSGDPGWSLVKVAGVYGAAQGLEGVVISPRILGDSVGLHPVWVFLALSIGGLFFGFAGLLIGVPLAVGVKLLLVRAVAHYKKSALYREGPAGFAE